MDNNENIIFEKQINWQPWIEKYGNPGLSTNVFDVDEKKYLLYHSYKNINRINLTYYCGILCLDDNLNPIAYTSNCIFPSFNGYQSAEYLSYFNWKRSLLCSPTIVDVVFPMNIIVDSDHLHIYAGINDFASAHIKIIKSSFIDIIKNEPFILL